MQAIEFSSQLEHGQIAVPENLHLMEGQPVRVLILLDESASSKEVTQIAEKSVWERTAGAWQGEPLVQEHPGDTARVAPISAA